MKCENSGPLERWLRPLPFAAFLALALWACFPQVLLGAESFFTRDYGVLAYPNIAYQRECFWRGEWPMWNPFSNCGQPFLAQWGTMMLYPGALIYLLLPLPWSLSLFCFAHVWLGGFGMYWLARSWTNHNFAAAIAGTAFVFNGITFASFVWPNYLVTLGWMPFVILLAERAWREGGRWVVGTSLVAALQMLSGAPEVVVFTWLIVAALWACDAIRIPVSTVPFFRRMLVVVVLTSGLMAVQLLPFFELLHSSHRDVSFGTAKWQLPLWGWANFLVPLYNAFETPSGQYYQFSQAFLSSVYVGGFAVALALVAFFRWPDPRSRVLTALAVFSVFFAFGDQTPIFGIARKALPFLGVARFPAKFLFIVSFVVPLLAGCGAAAVIRTRHAGMLALSGILVIAATVFIAWLAYGERFVDYSAWPENFRGNMHFTWHTPAAGRRLPDGILNTLARIGFLCLALIAFSATARGGARSIAAAFLALICLVLDAKWHTPDQNPTLPARSFTQDFWADRPKPQFGEARVMITPEAEDFLTYVSGTNAQRVWEFKRRAEWSNLNLVERIPKVNGSATLQTREQRLVEQRLYSMTNHLPAGLLNFLGVASLTSSNGANWVARSGALPLVTAGQQPVFADEAEALVGITSEAFDPQRVVFLPESTRQILPGTNTVRAHLSNVAVTARSISATVSSPEATLVVVAQSFYPAWRATVDDARAPLLRANVAFQAVPVPAGQHEIQFFYSDTRFMIGLGISAASLLISIIALCRRGPAGRLRHNV